MIIFYVPCSNRKEAERIARQLLKKGLVACTNYMPINSLYLWKGKIESGKEFLLITKTTKKKAKAVEREIRNIHSYEVPCILQIKAKANKEFNRWIISSLE